MNATVIQRNVIRLTDDISNTESEIAEIDFKISDYKNRIEDLRSEKRALERQKKREENRIREYCEDVSISD